MTQDAQTYSPFFWSSNAVAFSVALLFSCFFLTSFTEREYFSNTTENVDKLNNTIIFDLILNYELTEKNGNNSVLIDYLPTGLKDVSSVQMNSNYGGEIEATRFQYDKNGNLSEINYQVDDRFYEYVLRYEDNKVKDIEIAGKKKLHFAYRNDTLVTITREHSGMVIEYEISYVPKDKQANFKLFVTTNGTRRASSSRNFIKWDTNNNIAELEFDIYRLKDITHLPHGEWQSFTMIREGGQKNAEWQYVFDEKSNWTERTYDRFKISRKITYTGK